MNTSIDRTTEKLNVVILKTIIRKEIQSYLKNPLFYIGAVLVFFSVYGSVSPYLNLHYFNEDSEIRTLKDDNGELADADIMDGYIPATQEERIEIALNSIKKVLITSFDMKEKEAEEVISKIKRHNMSIPQITKFLEQNYSFYGANYDFYEASIKKATAEEANQYIKKELQKQTYTSYFSRKYADYLAVSIIFYAILMFAFLFIKDSRKDIYELLHTKPMKAWEYITGKIVGGTTAMLIVITIITAIFDGMAVYHGITLQFPVSIFDMWIAVVLYILPNVIMVACVYSAVAVLFKNPLPAVPALVLYMIYSNMGCRLSDGSYGYKIRKLAILVRFPDCFFQTVTPPQAVMNQLFLAGMAVLIMTGCTFLWKRRRVYET